MSQFAVTIMKRESENLQVNAKVLENSEASTNKKSFAQNEVSIPNSGCHLKRDIF
jgi:hypothetical protein